MMLKLAVMLALAAAAPAPVLQLPDYERYDPSSLDGYVQVCMAEMVRMSQGHEPGLIAEVARQLPAAHANRLRDVCLSFFLGADAVLSVREATVARPVAI